jgi:hypothetical protein
LAKFTNYMFLIAGVLILGYFFGLYDGGAVSGLLDMLLNPAGFQSSEYVLVILTGMGVVAGIVGGVVAPLLRLNFNPDIVTAAGVAIMLMVFAWDLSQMFTIIYNSSKTIALLVMSPLIWVYILSVLEWWRGVSL